MALGKDEILEWLLGLPDGVGIGVDDGGNCLRIVGDGEDGAHLEIGSLPEIITGQCNNGCPEAAGEFCTECEIFYCNKCYDTTQGEGCQYHKSGYNPATITMAPEPGSVRTYLPIEQADGPTRQLVLEHCATSLRVCLERVGLGDDDLWPDLFIERRVGRWQIWVHPDAGDPTARLFFYDDGRLILDDPDDNREDVELHRKDD